MAPDDRRFSVPNVALVEGRSMAFHDFTNLFLIAELFVMLGLVDDVGGNGFYIRLAHREGAISILPVKIQYPFLFEALRRRAFQAAD